MSLWRFLKHDLWIPWQSFAKDVHIEKKYLWRSIQKKYALWPMWLTCYLNALQTHYCASTFKILWTKYSEDFWMKWFILLHFSPFGISFTMYVDLRRLIPCHQCLQTTFARNQHSIKYDVCFLFTAQLMHKYSTV